MGADLVYNNNGDAVITAKTVAQPSCFTRPGHCPRFSRSSSRTRMSSSISACAPNAAEKPAILPPSFHTLFGFPLVSHIGGSVIAAMVGGQLEEQFMAAQRTADSAENHERPELRTYNRITPSDARRNLTRMMPFNKWCALLRPTEAAKELYLFVRARLRMRAAEENAVTRGAPTARVKRPRKPRARHAAPSKLGTGEQG